MKENLNLLESLLEKAVYYGKTSIEMGKLKALDTVYLKKVVVCCSGDVFRKILNSLLHVGLTMIVAQNPDVIKLVGHLFHQYFNNKKVKTA